MQRDIVPLPPIEPVRGYSPAHAGLYLDVSDQTIYKLIKERKLATRVVGKRRVVPGSELIRFLTGQEPLLEGDPIDPRISEQNRINGSAGGLAKARKNVPDQTA
jgi:excisionase family DNA binding protein